MDPNGTHPFGSSSAEPAPDEDLVRSVLSGDRERYAVLVRRYQERLYRYALGMVLDGDAAADVVQDAFVKAYSNLQECRDPSKFGAWAFQILRNRCLDYLKERRRKDVQLDHYDDTPEPGGGPDADLERWTLRDVLERALAQLPEAQREAFVLKHVHELTYEEISEVVDASESALRMRVLRARETLRSILREQSDRTGGKRVGVGERKM